MKRNQKEQQSISAAETQEEVGRSSKLSVVYPVASQTSDSALWSCTSSSTCPTICDTNSTKTYTICTTSNTNLLGRRNGFYSTWRTNKPEMQKQMHKQRHKHNRCKERQSFHSPGFRVGPKMSLSQRVASLNRKVKKNHEETK